MRPFCLRCVPVTFICRVQGFPSQSAWTCCPLGRNMISFSSLVFVCCPSPVCGPWQWIQFVHGITQALASTCCSVRYVLSISLNTGRVGVIIMFVGVFLLLSIHWSCCDSCALTLRTPSSVLRLQIQPNPGGAHSRIHLLPAATMVCGYVLLRCVQQQQGLVE